MKFGIYPGGRAATVCSHPPDPAAIGDLVDDLAGGNAFVVREYVHFFGDATPPDVVTSLGADDELAHLTMPDEWYVQAGRELDLVVSYIPQAADLSGWLAFLDTVIDRYGHLTRYLQVTLEPNFPIPLIDGSAPGVLEALTLGIPHARTALDRRGLHNVRVGFSVAEPPEWLGGDDGFWQYLSAVPQRDFADHVDYVGLGLYPDAFSPVALSDMINSILALCKPLNITHYELFSLWDADSGSTEPSGTLGIVSDTYRPKPAFTLYRDLVRR